MVNNEKKPRKRLVRLYAGCRCAVYYERYKSDSEIVILDSANVNRGCYQDPTRSKSLVYSSSIYVKSYRFIGIS